MKNYKLQFKPFGSKAILVEWPAEVKEEILLDMLAFQNHLDGMDLEDVIVGYHSLTLIFSSPIQSFQEHVVKLQNFYKSRSPISFSDRKIWEIPVYYESHNTDLYELSEAKGISSERIIEMHTEPKYLVYFIGFQPGFMYLGGLPKELHHPRRGNPKMVSKGSVAIGGSQTGLYPFESIGGWNVIGQSPVILFDPNQDPPCKVKSGDYVKFVPISKSEFEVHSGSVESKPFPHD